MIAATRADVPAILVTSSDHGIACASELVDDGAPSRFGGGGGVLSDSSGAVEARVDAVHSDLPAAIEAVRGGLV